MSALTQGAGRHGLVDGNKSFSVVTQIEAYPLKDLKATKLLYNQQVNCRVWYLPSLPRSSCLSALLCAKLPGKLYDSACSTRTPRNQQKGFPGIHHSQVVK